jgi:hypothetical protein
MNMGHQILQAVAVFNGSVQPFCNVRTWSLTSVPASPQCHGCLEGCPSSW